MNGDLYYALGLTDLDEVNVKAMSFAHSEVIKLVE